MIVFVAVSLCPRLASILVLPTMIPSDTAKHVSQVCLYLNAPITYGYIKPMSRETLHYLLFL